MPSRELVSRDLHRLALGGGAVDYMLVRRRGRRGVGLKVDEGGLTVSAPVTMARSRIEGFVRDSERWVLRKLEEWRARRSPPVEWTDGARLPWLGGGLALSIAPGARNHAERVDGELRVTLRAGGEAGVQRAVVAWYKRAAQEYLGERLAALAAQAGLRVPRLLLSPAMTRWGSCNTRREVRLAWRLAKAPPDLIDYVICHELAHLRHMDHSRAFWAEVERQCPDYRRLRRRLFATDHLYRSF
jgi:predicted metal-dependent hydrolase